jgi:hypothetical protein
MLKGIEIEARVWKFFDFARVGSELSIAKNIYRWRLGTQARTRYPLKAVSNVRSVYYYCDKEKTWYLPQKNKRPEKRDATKQ